MGYPWGDHGSPVGCRWGAYESAIGRPSVVSGLPMGMMSHGTLMEIIQKDKPYRSPDLGWD